jgi:hypothetical protein
MHHCSHCEQEIVESPVAPITVAIGDPESIGPDGIVVEFCTWQCLAMWANKQAGEILMPDLDAAFFGPTGPHEKW